MFCPQRCHSYPSCLFPMLRKMANKDANDRLATGGKMLRGIKVLQCGVCHLPSVSQFREREIQSLFSDAKSSCSFRIYICMPNKDIGCVVPVFLPLIWLENKRPQDRQNSQCETGSQHKLWVIFGVSWAD